MAAISSVYVDISTQVSALNEESDSSSKPKQIKVLAQKMALTGVLASLQKEKQLGTFYTSNAKEIYGELSGVSFISNTFSQNQDVLKGSLKKVELQEEIINPRISTKGLGERLGEIGRDTAFFIGARSLPMPKLAISSYLGSKELDKGVDDVVAKVAGVWLALQSFAQIAPTANLTMIFFGARTIDAFAKELRDRLPQDLTQVIGYDPETSLPIRLRDLDLLLQVASMPAAALFAPIDLITQGVKAALTPECWKKVGELIVENAQAHAKSVVSEEMAMGSISVGMID